MRIAIAGVPRAGKTTLGTDLSRRLHLELASTDALIGTHEWSDASAAVATWFAIEERVVEGVAVPRALRKWLAMNPGKPVDVVVWLATPHVELSRGQTVMAKGIVTVWLQVRRELEARGVLVLDG